MRLMNWPSLKVSCHHEKGSHEPFPLRLATHRNIERLCSPRVVARMKKPHIRKKRNGVWICTYVAIDGTHWTGRGPNPFSAYIACMRY